MEDHATNRMRVRLTDAEDAAVTQAAQARGMLPSALAREALLAYIAQPVWQPLDAGAAESPIMARLDALAGRLERQTQALSVALDLAYASEAERGDIRTAMTDIANSIGVLAGSIVMETDNGGPF